MDATSLVIAQAAVAEAAAMKALRYNLWLISSSTCWQ